MGSAQSDLSSSLLESLDTSNVVSFYINGKLHQVSTKIGGFGPDYKLVDYIRNVAGLRGTKFMCREGGCGACIVTVEVRDPANGTLLTKSVNSCLIPILNCDGWSISTVESLGNRQSGYSKIQDEMVHFGGSQCGFCSPGMVMTINSSLKGGKKIEPKDVEDLLDGNICRCTGYRPIIDAFKKLIKESPSELTEKCVISSQDLNSKISSYQHPCVNRQIQEMDFEKISKDEVTESINLESNIRLTFDNGEEWIVARTITAVFEAIQHFIAAEIPYKLVAGNTGTGVYKEDGPYKGYIDIGKIPALSLEAVDADGASLGSGMTIHGTIDFLQRASEQSGFGYAMSMSKHLLRIATVSVRNVGTLGGNLMVKHEHPEFPSDIFMLLATLNATLTIASSATTTTSVSIKDFLSFDMVNKLIISIHLPRIEGPIFFRSFKISRRYQSTHADVNAGFLLKISVANNFTVLDRPSIVYGGITSTFVHATATESFLIGKSLKDSTTIQGAMNTLKEEIQPTFQLPEASVEYRKLLTQSLLYKFILGVLGTQVTDKYQSGSRSIKRGRTSAKQVYDTDETVWPLNKPIPKLEAAVQCSGEAEYISDITPQTGELFGAFVLSSVAKAEIDSIDPNEALNLKGVQAVIQARDVQGVNNYMVLQDPEEIFASNKILYAGQSLCLVVAESRDIAYKAVKLVKVNYKNVQKPVLNIVDKLPQIMDRHNFKNGDNGIHLFDMVKGPEGPNVDPAHVIKGQFTFGGQYHHHLENQVTLVVPKEDGIQVYSATQWMDHVQAAVASALAIPSNEIKIEVRRIGGAYGSKISRASLVATACAVAAKKLNKPVRIILDLETNMRMIGKRSPYLAKYEAGVDTDGKIQSLAISLFADVGSVINDADIDDAVKFMQNCYDVTGWKITPAQILSDKSPNTYCRAPGTSQGIAIIENIMEHISFELAKDSVELRQLNLLQDGSPLLVPYGPNEKTFTGENRIVKMFQRMKTAANYQVRKDNIRKFNSENRWKKRGMAVVPLRYHMDYPGVKFPVYVAIYKFDGTVVVTHGGIEVGQGINTKVVQTVAYMFKIPVDMVRVTPTNNVIGANADLTGGSMTSELCCYAASVACQTLLDRMKPVRDKLKNPTWEQVVWACGRLNINLTASHLYTSDDPVKSYDIWALTLAECEIDCLTGEYKILRVDLWEDAGRSLNPYVDLGQIEGAFIMSIGWWTTENLIYDPDNGQLLTARTWNYQVPTAADIPTDFRITLLRKTSNPFGVLRSKALRNAIFSGRSDAQNSTYSSIDGPLTQEKILLTSLTDSSQFLI